MKKSTAILLTSLLTIFIAWIIQTFFAVNQEMAKRAKSKILFEAIKPYQDKVSKQLLDYGLVNPKEFSNAFKNFESVKYGSVDKSGTIILGFNDAGLLIVLQPSIVDGRVYWTCNAAPIKYAVAECNFSSATWNTYQQEGITINNP